MVRTNADESGPNMEELLTQRQGSAFGVCPDGFDLWECGGCSHNACLLACMSLQIYIVRGANDQLMAQAFDLQVNGELQMA